MPRSAPARRAFNAEQAWELCAAMQRQGVMLDVITCDALISACAQGTRPELTRELCMQRQGVMPNVINCTALISTCDKGTQAVRACELLEAMRGNADARCVSYCLYLQCLDQHLRGSQAGRRSSEGAVSRKYYLARGPYNDRHSRRGRTEPDFSHTPCVGYCVCHYNIHTFNFFKICGLPPGSHESVWASPWASKRSVGYTCFTGQTRVGLNVVKSGPLQILPFFTVPQRPKCKNEELFATNPFFYSARPFFL